MSSHYGSRPPAPPLDLPEGNGGRPTPRTPAHGPHGKVAEAGYAGILGVLSGALDYHQGHSLAHLMLRTSNEICKEEQHGIAVDLPPDLFG